MPPLLPSKDNHYNKMYYCYFYSISILMLSKHCRQFYRITIECIICFLYCKTSLTSKSLISQKPSVTQIHLSFNLLPYMVLLYFQEFVCCDLQASLFESGAQVLLVFDDFMIIKASSFHKTYTVVFLD